MAAALSVCVNPAAAKTIRPKSTSASGVTKARISKKGSKRYARRPRGQKAPAPERISEIQQALAKEGSFAGKPNGKWDSSTIEAMRKFQDAHGLNPTGKLDALTLQKLGLGSQTAGVAPPMAPISSSSMATSPLRTVRSQK
jgi:peptidoglycan hydrolase-like protein with peptidoglycan-binding domain